MVKVWDPWRLIVPIIYFIEKPPELDKNDLAVAGTVFIHADYTIPVQEMREELHRILDATPLWDKRVGGPSRYLSASGWPSWYRDRDAGTSIHSDLQAAGRPDGLMLGLVGFELLKPTWVFVK